MIYENDNLPTPLNEPGRPDAEACRCVLANQLFVENALADLSTREAFAVALALPTATWSERH
ncbi:hypothetical protein [Leisingera thetidis]|uniref:hypothetical protein n=1 Tax=Leisingera thetidis TaxID=2930199 RepID=UPI0021F76915|nr:hypothetical protein [Leisingera thetidis]